MCVPCRHPSGALIYIYLWPYMHMQQSSLFFTKRSWGVSQDMGASFERPHGTYFPKYRDSRVWTVHVDGSTDLGW